MRLTETQKHKFCQDTIALKQKIEANFVELGGRLYKIKQDHMHEAGWSSWEEFEMELKLSPATISKLMRIYEVFVVIHGFKPEKIAEAGGWTVVAEVLPLLPEGHTKKQASKWLDNAISMARADLRRTITEAKTGVSMAKCKHKDTFRVCFDQCRDCGDRWLVEENE